MRSHLRQVTKKKVSDFLLREEGMIGSRTGFATAAMVSTTALAMTLLLAPDAEAHNPDGRHCPNHPYHCGVGEHCCWIWKDQVMTYKCFAWNQECPKN